MFFSEIYDFTVKNYGFRKYKWNYGMECASKKLVCRLVSWTFL